MGWADEAIWRHVTGLVGATLHKCEDWEQTIGEPPAAAAATAACVQNAGAHSKSDGITPPDIYKTYVKAASEKETTSHDSNCGFFLTHEGWLSLLLCKICVGWMMRL